MCIHPTTTFLSQLQHLFNSFIYGLKFSHWIFGKIAAVAVASDFILYFQHYSLREAFGEKQEGTSTVAMVSLNNYQQLLQSIVTRSAFDSSGYCVVQMNGFMDTWLVCT